MELKPLEGLVETAKHGGLDNIKQKAWESGFDTGASQMYSDVDKILKDAVTGPHWAALMATGVLHKIIELKAFYKVDGK